MRLVIATAICLAFVAPAAAEQWRYEGGTTPIAWFDTGEAQFQFACRGGVLTMGFWVRKPDAAVAAASAISLAITPDTAAGASWSQTGGTSFAQDMPLVHLEGSSVIVRGPVARQWARIAQNARETVRVAFVRMKGSSVEAIDPTLFGAKGSKSTIERVLGQCS